MGSGPHRAPAKPTVDWKSVAQSNQKLQAKLKQFLDNATPKGVEAAHSVETTLLGQELRSDWQYGAGGKPLRLLSLGTPSFVVVHHLPHFLCLDGGGVRGISSLYVLKAVMNKITGDPNAKPCDYFDMMAGTSTGGYNSFHSFTPTCNTHTLFLMQAYRTDAWSYANVDRRMY